MGKKMQAAAALMNFAAAAMLAGLMGAGTALAAPVLCQNPAVNHMNVDSAYVSACLDAGVGNLTGNPANDLFITGVGGAYSSIGAGAFGQSGNTGTFSLNPALWNTYGQIAIGFKFGTGNKPDEWFVYALNSQVSSGTWSFVNVFGRGGGLSHVNLYGIPGTQVPESGTLALMGLALVALGCLRRRSRTI